MNFGLYVHIPFCAARCPYCDFTITITARRPEKRYTAALLAELRARWESGTWAGGELQSVYFGGGTPSLVDPAMIEAVLEEMRQLAGTGFRPREVTLEANPEGLNPAWLARWRSAGVDRLSVGAQSFNDDHLAFLGRGHTAPDIRRAVSAARDAGYRKISLDLIFGMPGQSLQDLDEELDCMIALDPPHVSAYNLTMEPGTAHYRQWKKGAFTLPDEEVQSALFERVSERLSAAGLGRYEISNFARKGHKSVHNRHYWLRGSYLGIGTGAHSCHAKPEGGTRWWNIRDHRRYIERALSGESCTESVEKLSALDARREWAFLRLRAVKGFRQREFQEQFAVTFDEAFPGVLDRLREAGLIAAATDRVCLTDRGRLLSDDVFLSLF
jgi:oxygen-independent coproporphyrinogen-3 oxidase